MTIKQRIKAWAQRARPVIVRIAERLEASLRRFYAALHRWLSPPVHVHRRKNQLTIANAPRIGGQLHLAEIGGAMSVEVSGTTLQVGGQRISYADPQTAQAAYREVRRVLLPTSGTRWAARAAGLLIAWMVCRAVFAAVWGAPSAPTQEQAASGTELQGLAAAMAADPTFVPPEAVPQAMPGDSAAVGGDLADRIYRESQAAAQAQMHQAMPPQPGASVEGLNGFGLEEGAGAGGPGCDPQLAFRVDR